MRIQTQPLLLFLLFALVAGRASAFERFDDWLAQISSFDGAVQGQKASTRHWRPVAIDDRYFQGDSIRTLDRSRARLLLPNETYWDLEQNSRVNLTAADAQGPDFKRVLLELMEGMALFRSRRSQSIHFRTPRLSGANSGTEFLVEAGDEATIVTVYDGRVDTWNEFGRLSVQRGQSAIARKGEAPRLYLRVKPEDAVQWALYYPPVIDVSAGSDLHRNSGLAPALAAYGRNDIRGALELLAQVPEAARDSRFHNLRAGLLLTVGRVDEARADIQAALKLRPGDGTALAQQAIVAIAGNDKDAGLALARQADAGGASFSAKLALSYAHQAHFDLAEARHQAERAVALAPASALALTRLAEMELSLGQFKKGQAAARQALQQVPDHARALALLGFAELMLVDTDDAVKHFNEAIERDPADPLIRFGLGLAKIRQGDVAQGTVELEQAASLDPDDPLIRSYLGKAYYEQKRSEPAEAEFRRARELDPKDPTPYFYEAIKKQTENRPVEALNDLQKAMRLNHNRAIYRSKQKLDSDLAARGGAIGRIYGELGFGQQALVSAWRGLATDPTDYTSHRLLSDAYGSLPRHDLARTSELLQSQLLQPINITPVQPRLAESSLFLTGNLGPSDLSLNEFNPLFERNHVTTLISGLVGSHDTFSDEAVHSGLFDNLSYSLGQFHYETKGFRENNDVHADIYTAFAQYQVRPELSIQAEYRRREVDFGDQRSSFFNAPVEQARAKATTDTARFGFGLAPGERSRLLGAFNFAQRTARIYNDPDQVDLLIRRTTNGELQHVYSGQSYKSIVGASFSEGDTSYQEVPSRQKQGIGYFYNYLDWPNNVQWIFGGNVSIVQDSGRLHSRSFNPKLGLIWNMTEQTMLRASAIRGVRYITQSGQLLEPSHVAGFNQFYDDKQAGTRFNRIGIGIDHQFNARWNVGAELSGRTLTVPTGGHPANHHWRETTFRGYLTWTPTDRWVASLEYFREDFENLDLGKRPPFKSRPINTDTQYIPVAIAYYWPNGWFARIKGTHYYQSARSTDNEGDDRALFIDLGFGYRLPKRTGIFEIQIQNILDQRYRHENLADRVQNPLYTEGVPAYRPFPTELTVSARITLAF